MQEPTNPYATPTAATFNINQTSSPYEVFADQLTVLEYTELPAVCYKTGEPVTPGVNGKTYRKTIHYYSQWLALLIFLGIIGIIAYIAIYYSTRKKLIISYSLSNEARKKITNKRIFGYSTSFLILAASIYTIYYGFSEYRIKEDFVFLGLGGIVLFLIAIIVTKSISSVVRVKKYSLGRFTLAGAGPRFLQYLQSHR